MAQAPVLNALFGKVQQDPQLKDKLKFMAVAQAQEGPPLQFWKGFHKVPFPLIPDPKSALGDALKFHPYPVSVVLDKSGKILWVHIGTFESADETLKAIKAVVK